MLLTIMVVKATDVNYFCLGDALACTRAIFSTDVPKRVDRSESKVLTSGYFQFLVVRPAVIGACIPNPSKEICPDSETPTKDAADLDSISICQIV